jgi:hypothetical protein
VIRSRRAVVIAAVTAVALTGCTSSRTAAEPDPSRSTTPVTATTDPTAGAASGAPTPGSTTIPETTSGSLSRTDFPTPRELGAGWAYSVDPGDAEEGYAGNGTPALERSPEEIAQTAVPFGCGRASAMPTPGHALEVDYTFAGAKVIAVRSEFRDRSTARKFFTGRSRNLGRCLGRTGSAAIGPLVDRITRPATDAVASDRTPKSDPWQEIAVLDGSTVAMVAVQGPGRLSDSQTRRIVALLRG